MDRQPRVCYTCRQLHWMEQEEWNCDLCKLIEDIQRFVRNVTLPPQVWSAVKWQLESLLTILRAVRFSFD